MDIGDEARAGVRKATQAELLPVAQALGEAFSRDPVFRWFLRDDPRIGHVSERFFDYGLRRIWAPHDEIYTTSQFAGGAVWEKPGRAQTSVLRQVMSLPSFVAIFRRHLPRMLRAVTIMERTHPHDVAHYYLPFVGVSPRHQGHGIGSALLQPVLARCDQEGVPAYLEATSPRNRALYLRHGWQDRGGPLTLGKGAPPIWPMWREPAS